MFERFTDRARRVVVLAQEEARMLNHNYIGTEHILLGLIHEGEGVAAKALESLGISLEGVRQQVEEIIGQGQQAPSGHIPFTPRAKKVLELSLREALQLGHNYIGTEHILLGLIREGEGVAAQVLVKLGADLNRVRQQVIQLLSGYQGKEPASAGGPAEGTPSTSLVLDQFGRNLTQAARDSKLDEYRKHLEKDAALERRFQPIQVGEPTLTHTIEILKGLRDRYEAHHRISITDGALVAAATLADRYISDRFLPDKAIDLIDEAGARMRIKRMTAPPDLREFDDRIAGIRREKESAIDAQDFEKAASLRDQEKTLLSEKAEREKQWKAGDMDVVAEVDDEQIAEVLANWTGIPVFKLTEEETTRLLRMEDELHKRIIGQEEAIKSVSQAIRRTRAGLKDPRRPGGSFIFAGPSGVGKTELAKALAQFLFGEDDALIQIDMGEFHDRFTVSRLVGAPPGYVGYDEGGQLTEKVRRKPFSVVLFDEIEKAHQDVFNTLLQVLEDGRLTDGQGRVVDFKNTILILTTNLGTRDISKAVGLGFQKGNDDQSNYERMKNKVNEELKQHFRPEFLNRIDDIVVFHQLTEDEIVRIVDLMLARVEGQLANKDMSLEVTPAGKKLLAARGFDPVLGARPLRRTIQREIEDALSEKILYGELTSGQIIVVDVDGEGPEAKFTFRGEAKPVDLPDTPPVALAGGDGDDESSAEA